MSARGSSPPQDRRRGGRRRGGGAGAAVSALLVAAAASACAAAAAEPISAGGNDVLASLLALADGLYNHQDLSAVDAYCDDDVLVHVECTCHSAPLERRPLSPRSPSSPAIFAPGCLSWAKAGTLRRVEHRILNTRDPSLRTQKQKQKHTNINKPNQKPQGDGLWLPRVDFAGARWLRSIHREWFAAYSGWSCEVVAAALGTPVSVAAAVRDRHAAEEDQQPGNWGRRWPVWRANGDGDGSDDHNRPGPQNGGAKYVSAFALFRWEATNTAPYRGVGPTLRRSEAWGVIEAALWAPGSKQAASGRAVAALTLRDSGFLEVREASLQRPQPSFPLRGALEADLRASPEWVPSASLRQGAAARLTAVLASLAVGGGGGGGAARMAAVAGAMADGCADGVVLADGTDLWGPRAPPEAGKGAVAAWLALWAEQRGVERAEVAASAAASTSDKVFVSFRLAVPASPDDDDDGGGGGGMHGGGGGGAGGRGVGRTAGVAAEAAATATITTAAAAPLPPQKRQRQRRRQRLWPPSRAAYVEGVAVGVYDEAGRIARIVLFRNGSPSETRAELIGGGGYYSSRLALGGKSADDQTAAAIVA